MNIRDWAHMAEAHSISILTAAFAGPEVLDDILKDLVEEMPDPVVVTIGLLLAEQITGRGGQGCCCYLDDTAALLQDGDRHGARDILLDNLGTLSVERTVEAMRDAAVCVVAALSGSRDIEEKLQRWGLEVASTPDQSIRRMSVRRL